MSHLRCLAISQAVSRRECQWASMIQRSFVVNATSGWPHGMIGQQILRQRFQEATPITYQRRTVVWSLGEVNYTNPKLFLPVLWKEVPMDFPWERWPKAHWLSEKSVRGSFEVNGQSRIADSQSLHSHVGLPAHTVPFCMSIPVKRKQFKDPRYVH